ncbi:hypothetical protein J437_LFUL000269 [Ladona fulva]|uniref:Ig-like domain-containing protein n=1 Tax=Ladona fulva TaxID=123851 RepID=A0A8K0NYI5_LADFU|nr:hypothetical protein J437_LFUL000269 [Ladona fulva]
MCLTGLRIPGGPSPAVALRLLDLKVPENAELNGNVTLECSFDLGNEGANLYCVKWYKDGYEFFRFSPDDRPPIKLFPNSGIIVDEKVAWGEFLEVNGGVTFPDLPIQR